MGRKRHTPEQIITALREAEVGLVGARGRRDALYRAGQPVGERLQRELQRQAQGRAVERGDLLLVGGGGRAGRAMEARVQYRPTPSCPRRTTPRPRDDKTIALVPQDAPTPGTTDGSRSNIGSGTATGGTSHGTLGPRMDQARSIDTHPRGRRRYGNGQNETSRKASHL